MRILERKLKSTVNADQEKSLYDIHSNEHRDTFEIISAIWNNFYHRILSSKEIKPSFKEPLNCQPNQNFLLKFQRCLNICMEIWKIVNKHFKSLISNLISGLSKNPTARKQPENAWKFLLDCSNKVELLMKASDAQIAMASKCSSVLLKIISDVIDNFDFSPEKLSNIRNWLCRISKKNISGEKETTALLLQLFLKLENKEFSSCMIIKHLLNDYNSYILNRNAEADIQNGIETIQEFKILNEQNSAFYHNFLLKELESSIEQIKWALSLKNYFHQSKLISLICTNFEAIIMSFDFAIQSTRNISTVNLTFEKTALLLELLTQFFEANLTDKFSHVEIQMLKRLSQIVDTNLLNDFESKLNRINEILLASNQNVESLNLTTIMTYKKLLTQLLNNLGLLEDRICLFYQKHKNNDTIKEFKPHRSCINLSFETKINMPISQNQFNIKLH